MEEKTNMNFADKLKDWRNRLRDRHMFTIVISSFLVIIALLGYIFKIRNDNKQALENRYNQAFYEMSSYIENIDTLLAKSLVSKDPTHGAKTMSEVWRQANLAKTNLSQLPIEQNLIAQTSKFLSQTSDFSRSLTLQTIDQKPITEEQLGQIKSLSDYANKLQTSILDLSSQLSEGRLSWNKLTNKGSKTFAKLGNNSEPNTFQEMSDSFQDYPGLIYDGPFSDHITELTPKGITGENIDQEKAKKIATDFIGSDRIKEITSISESFNSKIPCYSLSIKLKSEEEANMDISQKGGHVIWFLYNKDVKDKKLTIDDAKAHALEFLNSRGLTSMKSTYYIEENNIATLNFAYTQNDVTIYPDLIKVAIAMDNGDITGFESAGYLFSHEQRVIKTPKITNDEALTNINKGLNPEYTGLAIIPTDVKTEVLVHEFKGKVDNRDFIVYINAETGKEEDILIIINTPNGILTI